MVATGGNAARKADRLSPYRWGAAAMADFDGEKPVILVISDDLSFRKELAEVVNKAGCSVLCFGDERSTKAAISQAAHFEIAIIDLLLPRDGWIDYVQSVRDRSPQPGIFVVNKKISSKAR